MKTLRLLLILGFAASGVAGVRCLAGDPATTLDSVLAKWEEASQKCKSLDAKLTVFRYDVVFGKPAITTHGRFYYEAPNVARYEIRDGGNGKPSDWSRLPEVWIWNGKEGLWIDGKTRTCHRFPVPKRVASGKSHAAPATTGAELPKSLAAPGSESLFDFLAALAEAVRKLQDPREVFPLVMDIHAAEVRKRYTLTVERSGEDIELKAVPKQSADRASYREIGVILNAKTCLTRAIQLVQPNGKDRVVFVFDEQKVNQRPSDRDQLLHPDLFGLRMVDWGP